MPAARRAQLLIGSVAILLAATFFPGRLNAHHSWGKYHWERSTNPESLDLGNNLGSGWGSHLSAAIGDWNASSVLDLRAAWQQGPWTVRVLVANALNYAYNLVPETLAPVRTGTLSLTWAY